MKSQVKKVLILILFLVMFVGGALFMYFNYIHNKPKLKFEGSRILDENKRIMDSLMKEKNKRD